MKGFTNNPGFTKEATQYQRAAPHKMRTNLLFELYRIWRKIAIFTQQLHHHFIRYQHYDLKITIEIKQYYVVIYL